MVEVTVVAQYGLELLAVVAAATFTGAMLKRRSAPTVRPLLVVAGSLFVGSVAHVLLVHPTPVRRTVSNLPLPSGGGPLWLGVSFLVVLVGGGFWFLFTLQYTGRGEKLISVAAAGIVAYWLVLVATGLLVDLPVDQNSTPQSTGELVMFVGSYLMGVLVVVGSALLLTTALRRNAVRTGEAVALATGGVLMMLMPIAGNLFMQANVVPLVIVLASGSITAAVARYPAFDAPPVARIAGRDRLIEEMDDPVVVVDVDGRTRDLNAAARRHFVTDGEAPLGESLEVLLPTALDPERVAAAQDPVQVRSATGRIFACTGNEVTDARDRSFGHLLVFRDVTARQRRERRLTVLTRLLTGTVGDRMAAVAETVDPVTTDGGGDTNGTDPSIIGAQVRDETTRLLDLVAWTRDIERCLASDATDPVPVSPVVHEVARAVTADEDVDVTVEATEDVGPAAISERLLKTVVEMVLTDAVDRGADAVRVTVNESAEGTTVAFVVSGGTWDPDGDAGEAATAHEAGFRNDPLIETARQAVEYYDGRLRVRSAADGPRRTVVELPGAPDDRGDEDPSMVDDDPTTPPAVEYEEGSEP